MSAEQLAHSQLGYRSVGRPREFAVRWLVLQDCQPLGLQMWVPSVFARQTPSDMVLGDMWSETDCEAEAVAWMETTENVIDFESAAT